MCSTVLRLARDPRCTYYVGVVVVYPSYTPRMIQSKQAGVAGPADPTAAAGALRKYGTGPARPRPGPALVYGMRAAARKSAPLLLWRSKRSGRRGIDR